MAEPKIAVIGKPGKWSTEILADAVKEKTGFRLVIDMNQVCLDLAQNKLFFEGHDLCGFDALIVKKVSSRYNPNTLDRLELLRIAENAGVHIFSAAENILRLIDRLSCTVTLRQHNIPMPETSVTESTSHAIEVVKKYGSAVFKPLFSTKARGMCVIDTDSEDHVIEQQIKAFNSNHQMMYIQRKIDLPGKDLGLVFLGGQYLGTYARVSQTNAWNTTINSGGRYEAYTPSDEIIDIAYNAQAPFNLDYTTVDIAETDQGPVVFEVSAFGGFRGAFEGAGINAAQLYVDYVYKALQ